MTNIVYNICIISFYKFTDTVVNLLQSINTWFIKNMIKYFNQNPI